MAFSKDTAKLDNQEKAMEQLRQAIVDLKRELNAPSRQVRSWRMAYCNWRRKVQIMDEGQRKAFLNAQADVSAGILQVNNGINRLKLLQSPVSDSTYQDVYTEAQKTTDEIETAYEQLNDLDVVEKRLGKQLKRFKNNLDKWNRQCIRAEKAHRDLPAFPTVKIFELYKPKQQKIVIVSASAEKELAQLDRYATGAYANTFDNVDDVIKLAKNIGAPVLDQVDVSWATARANAKLDDAIKAARDSHNAFGGQRNSNSGSRIIERFVESVDAIDRSTDLKSLERAEKRFKAVQKSMLSWWSSYWHERGGVPRRDVNRKHWKVPDWAK